MELGSYSLIILIRFIKKILNKIKENIYIIIPITCICFWSLFYLIKENYNIRSIDFKVVYTASKTIFTNPELLYKPKYRFYYLPSFGIFLAIAFCLIPFSISEYLYYAFITISALLSIREFNFILKYMNIHVNWHRFLFLIIISNGFFVFYQFYMSQFKFIIAALLFFIVRRELDYRKNNKNKDLKYFIINYSLFIFIIGIFIYFLLLLIIYIFQDIKFKNILKKENIIRYLIIIVLFFAENFLFFIYPNYIADIIYLFSINSRKELFIWGFPLFYLKEWLSLSLESYYLISLISFIYLIFITLILIFKTNLKLEEKFAFFSLASLIFNFYGERAFVIYIPFVLLLFVPYLITEQKLIEFIKFNKMQLMGLFSMLILSIMPPADTIFRYFNFLQSFPLIIIIYMRWIMILCLLLISLLILHFKGKKLINS